MTLLGHFAATIITTVVHEIGKTNKQLVSKTLK